MDQKNPQGNLEDVDGYMKHWSKCVTDHVKKTQSFVVKRNLIQANFDRVLKPISVVLRSSSFQTSEHEKPENALAFVTLNWPSIV